LFKEYISEKGLKEFIIFLLDDMDEGI